MTEKKISVGITVTGSTADIDKLTAATDKAKGSADKLSSTTVDPDADAGAITDLEGSVGDAQTAADDLASTSIDPDADSTSVDDLATSIGDAQTAADDLSNTDVSPTVDPSDIDGLGTSAADAAAQIIASLQEAGMSLDDIAARAAALQQAISDAGAAGPDLSGVTAGADEMGNAFGDAGAEVGGTDAMVAGFVAKATTKLPGVGEALGPMSKGLGQIVKGALAGEQSLGQMAKAGLSLGAISAVLAVVNVFLGAMAKHDAEIEATNAFHRERVDTFTNAIRDAKDATKALNDALSTDEKISFVNSAGETQDAVDSLVTLGQTFESYQKLLAGSGPAILDWQIKTRKAYSDIDKFLDDNAHKFWSRQEETNAALASSNPIVHAYGESLAALAQNSTDLSAAEANAADRTTFFGKAVDDTAAKGIAASSGLGVMSDAVSSAKDELNAATTATSEMDSAYQTLMGRVNAREAWRTAEQAIWDYAAATKNGTDNTTDGGAALDVLRTKLGNYTRDLQGIPPQVKSTIYADLDDGNIAAAEAHLNAIARTRSALFDVVVRVPGGVGANAGGGRAEGGPTFAGSVHPILEKGESEVLTEGGRSYLLAARNGQVTPLGRSTGAGGAGGFGSDGPTVVVNVTVNNAGSAIAQADLVDSIRDALIDQMRRGVIPRGAFS